jgi:hypothetical protein
MLRTALKILAFIRMICKYGRPSNQGNVKVGSN